MKCERTLCTRGSKGGSRYCWPHLRAMKAAGLSGRCDASPAREHIAALQDRGWSQRQIALRSGVSAAIVHAIVRGVERVYCTTSTAILNVPLVSPPPTRKHAVYSIGAARRINALRYMGWPESTIAEKTGIAKGSIRNLAQRNRTTCLLSTHLEIARVYDELSMTRGPSRGAATRARMKGFVSPLCWDEETIDDPSARPEGFSRYRRARYLGRAA